MLTLDGRKLQAVLQCTISWAGFLYGGSDCTLSQGGRKGGEYGGQARDIMVILEAFLL